MSTRSFLRAKRFSTADILFFLFRTIHALGKMLVEIKSRFTAAIFELKMSLRAENSGKRPYSVLEVLLNNEKDAAESQLGSGLFYEDKAGQMEEMVQYLMTLFCKTQGVSGGKRARLSADLFNQEKLILNGVDFTVDSHHHKPEICWLSLGNVGGFFCDQ